MKVNVKDTPVKIVSEEKAAGAPAPEAMAWGAPSLFTLVTTVPVFTVREGSDAKFLIVNIFPLPDEAGGAA
jgi:hypothetical protein